jgi:hypothetical protein
MGISANHVQVINGTDTHIEGRYDGEDYAFPPNEKVIVPLVVAAHILGFGVPDKRRTLMMLGWLRYSDEEKPAMEKLKKIRFEAVEMVGKTLDDEEGTPSESLAPEPLQIGSSARPGDAAGGEEGTVTVPSVSAPPDEGEVV